MVNTLTFKIGVHSYRRFIPRNVPFPLGQSGCSRLDSSRLVFHKSSFMGLYTTSSFEKKTPKKLRKKKQEGEGALTKRYQNQIPIKKAKWKDLQDLTAFLERAEAKAFFQKLPFADQPEESDEEYVDDPPIDI